MNKHKASLFLSILIAAGSLSACAPTMPKSDETKTPLPTQSQSMSNMDQQTTPAMDHDAMVGMDHSKMPDMNQDAMPAMDHSAMSGMDHDAMAGMDHSKMPGMNTDSMPAMDHGAMSGMHHNTLAAADQNAMADMDHSSMTGMSHGSMQGGTAPADARDPHAYSGGYSLDSGPYALPGPRQLRLADEHNMAALMVDRLETVHTSDNNSTTYDLQAWYGRDYDRAVLKVEGDYDNSAIQEMSTELLWGHALTAYWDTQLGMRYDSGEEPNRSWLAFGVQGLAPYWFEVSATAYLGEESRSAVNVEVEYDLLLTQKLILQPRLEADFYGKEDTEHGIGSGLSTITAGLRVRYEIRREFAPYFGVEWNSMFGATADFAQDAGGDSTETRAIAGLRFWF